MESFPEFNWSLSRGLHYLNLSLSQATTLDCQAGSKLSQSEMRCWALVMMNRSQGTLAAFRREAKSSVYFGGAVVSALPWTSRNGGRPGTTCEVGEISRMVLRVFESRELLPSKLRIEGHLSRLPRRWASPAISVGGAIPTTACTCVSAAASVPASVTR